MTWLARYDGTCGKCQRRIRADRDEVYWLDPSAVEEGRALGHVSCPPAPPEELPVDREPCSRCFQVPSVTGECGCP